jgi:hypothetical protein
MGDPVDFHEQPILFFAERILAVPLPVSPSPGVVEVKAAIGTENGCSYYTNVLIIENSAKSELPALKEQLLELLKPPPTSP